MKKLLTILSKVGEIWIIFFVYLFGLFMLGFGFRILYTIWKAIIG